MIQYSKIDLTWRMVHRASVRTPLTLDDDILELATRQAKLERVSLGKAASDLVRHGLNAPASCQEKDGIVMFRLAADSPPVSAEEIRRIESEGT